MTEKPLTWEGLVVTAKTLKEWNDEVFLERIPIGDVDDYELRPIQAHLGKLDEELVSLGAVQRALSSPELLERLAELEHEQWSEWIKRMENLKVIVDVPIREMWLKLACTSYRDLSEKGKESDRVFARKVLKVLGVGSGEKKEGDENE